MLVLKSVYLLFNLHRSLLKISAAAKIYITNLNTD